MHCFISVPLLRNQRIDRDRQRATVRSQVARIRLADPAQLLRELALSSVECQSKGELGGEGVFEQKPVYEVAAYVGAYPASVEDYLLVALRWAGEQLSVYGGELTVVAPALDQFRQTRLSELPKSVKRASYKQLGRVPRLSTVVIVCWPDVRLLERVDSASATKAILVLPWLRDEMDAWISARRAVDVLGVEPARAEPTISDPVVAAAMKSVTMMVNLSTGLSHPMDRPKAVSAFRILRNGGHSWTEAEIHAWAMANGWRPADARELAELGQKIADGQRVQTKGGGLSKESLRIWRDEAAAAQIGE